MEISDIGSSDTTALLCHTNRPPPYGGTSSGGEWFAPNGTRVGGLDSDVPEFDGIRGPMVLRLRRRTTSTIAEGDNWCTVNDDAGKAHTVHVGLFNSTEGILYQSYCVSHNYIIYQRVLCHLFSVQLMLYTHYPYTALSGGIPQFILTCISTGGPATTVTWTRDSTTTVTEGTETVLDDPVTAQYTHTLNVTSAGNYKCTVINSVSSLFATITLQGNI